jgi:acyl-CoA thioester hydrolase
MHEHSIQIRVRYSETDRMGYAYYGNYSVYFEVARVETMKSLGVSYKELEDSGIMLPVLEYSIKYFKPAYYDDLLTVKTTIPEEPGVRIRFLYETYNQSGTLLNKAETSLVFVDSTTMKPIKTPDQILNKFRS